MTELLFRSDTYQREAVSRVIGHTPEGGVLCEASLFYPTGGGQPGDSGTLSWEGQSLPIATAVKVRETGAVALVPGEPGRLPPVGAEVTQTLDWDRRHRHMRVHTALHLLSVVIPLPVTGGSISAEKGRLDFDMPEMTQDKEALQELLTDLVDRDLIVSEDWISEADLDRQPDLIKTMSVAPPRGAGAVRLIRIGEGDEQVDLQPCGGTHVARTGEIGALRLGKFEKKGRQNRRVYLHLGE